MENIKCNKCGREFDATNCTQCTCGAPIGTIRVFRKENNKGIIYKRLVVERIGTLADSSNMLLEDEQGCDVEFEYRAGEARYSPNNRYPGNR